MAEALFIKRRKTDDSELSFDSLRSDAIKLLQQFSGQNWTDYNLHDPGVTILEQLIYALTDLIYRSDFDVADYLAGSDGKINFKEQNLVDPAEVLSCRATTTLDYRKLIMDAVPEVDNVWLQPKAVEGGNNQYQGLYQLLVKLAQGLDEPQQVKEVTNKILATYHASRNLCEDLDSRDLKIVKNQTYELCAKIEVGSAWQPEKLLAEIYFDCARRMASSVSIADHEHMPGRQKPLDESFDGPYTSHGFYIDDDTEEHRSDSLITAIRDQGYELCRHLDFAMQNEDSDEFKLFSLEVLIESGYERPEQQPPLDLSYRELADDELHKSMGDILPLRNKVLSDKLLAQGIDLGRYRIWSSDKGRQDRLLLMLDENSFWHLGDFTDGPGAIKAANCLRQFLLRLNNQEFLVSTLFATINSIDGVDHIHKLYLEKDKIPHYIRIETEGSEQAFDLLIPESIDKIRVDLTTNGRKLPIDVKQVIARYDELKFKYYASRTALRDLSLFYQPITGDSRPFDQYSSVQNHFPAKYGVNQHGMPASARPDEKARARQLKAYLLIFEQLLVNFLANIDTLKTIFSKTAKSDRSYAVQTLTERQVADLRAVYPQNPGEVLGRIMARFDNFNERKNRLLDYLLAMYGERFSQNSLRHFNFYYDKDEIENKIVANKIDFLESIIEFGRDRAAAPDYYNAEPEQDPAVAPDYYSEKPERSRGGFAIRAAMLLGFEQREQSSLTSAIRGQDYEVHPSLDFAMQNVGSDGYRLFSIEGLKKSGYEQPEQPPLDSSYRGISIDDLRKSMGDILPLRNNILSDNLLAQGIDIGRYRILSSNKGQQDRLLLKLDENKFWHLGDFADGAAALKAANCLRQLLLKLNRDSEGLYIVEHLLLRPQRQPLEDASAEDFYSFKISVVFPIWTRRCADKHFRNLAEETLRLNAPAHVFPEFCWLDFADMKTFECLHNAWLALKIRSDSDSAKAELDDSAKLLAEFLSANHQVRPTGA